MRNAPLKHLNDLLEGTPVTLTDESLIIYVDLADLNPNGFFSIQPETSGAGTLKIEWLGSNKPASVPASYGVPFIDGTVMSDIISSHSAGVATAYGFSPPLTGYGAFKLTATGEVTITTLIPAIK